MGYSTATKGAMGMEEDGLVVRLGISVTGCWAAEGCALCEGWPASSFILRRSEEGIGADILVGFLELLSFSLRRLSLSFKVF